MPVPEDPRPLWAQPPFFSFPYYLNVVQLRITACLVMLSAIFAVVFREHENFSAFLMAFTAIEFLLRFIFGGLASVVGVIAACIA